MRLKFKDDDFDEENLWPFSIERTSTVAILKKAIKNDLNLLYIPLLWRERDSVQTAMKNSFIIANYLVNGDIINVEGSTGMLLFCLVSYVLVWAVVCLCYRLLALQACFVPFVCNHND